MAETAILKGKNIKNIRQLSLHDLENFFETIGEKNSVLTRYGNGYGKSMRFLLQT
jgi:hypothetical protein